MPVVSRRAHQALGRLARTFLFKLPLEPVAPALACARTGASQIAPQLNGMWNWGGVVCVYVQAERVLSVVWRVCEAEW